MTELKRELMGELACRREPVLVAALVADYGSEAKVTLREMRRAGCCRLICNGLPMAQIAQREGIDLEELKAGSIPAAVEGQFWVYAE